MENHGSRDIYDQPASAPYLDRAWRAGTRATAFHDALADDVLSEPHYITMEAGTHRFSDRKFCTDAGPTNALARPTTSTDHLTAQMMRAMPTVSWMTYQEGIEPDACPIHSIGASDYAPKHDPFVFFADIVGNKPTADAPICVAHHRPYPQLSTDLAADTVAQYVFITPSLANDMHDGCSGSGDRVRCGDMWLGRELPGVLAYANTHDGLVLVVWDEGRRPGDLLPFYAFGPSVAVDFESRVAVNHRSLVRTIDEIFGLPILDSVKNDTDLADIFIAKKVPTAIMP